MVTRLLSTAGALAALLLAAQPAAAQHHGGGHPGGGGFHGGPTFHGGGGFHGGPVYHGGGAYHGGYPGHFGVNPGWVHGGYPYHHGWAGYGRPFYGLYGFGLGYSTLAGLGYDLGYPGNYGYSGYYDAPFSGGTAYLSGSPYYTDVAPYDSGYNVPTVPYESAYPPPPPEPASDGSVLLTVQVPPDARVTVEGVPMNTSGSVRQFRSPPLEPGRDYTYTVTAAWTENGQPVTRTRQVTVRAGQQALVNFLGA
jgi:uncharacterized protein (TIGR03000 family)